MDTTVLDTTVLDTAVLDTAPAMSGASTISATVASDAAVPPVVAAGEPLAAGYICDALLSRGEAFDVYAAWSRERYCRCVVKVLRPDVTSPLLRRRLLFEGRLLNRLDHPYLLRGYEVRTDPALVASRLLSGYTLGQWIEGGSRPAAADLAQMASQLSSGLRYLHGTGYLHLDVKPRNIVVGVGAVTLLDFSLVQRPGRVRRRTGTPRFMSPEQARGGAVGPAADVWGLGITLFEAATGRSPFADAWDDYGSGDCPTCAPPPEGSSVPARASARPLLPQERLRAPAVRSMRARLPRDLAGAIDACLEPDPARRPGLQGLADVVDCLDRHTLAAPGGISTVL